MECEGEEQRKTGQLCEGYATVRNNMYTAQYTLLAWLPAVRVLDISQDLSTSCITNQVECVGIAKDHGNLGAALGII